MRYLHDSRSLFLHIPRCGGTFVEEALDLCGIGTDDWEQSHPRCFCSRHALLSHCYRDKLAEVDNVFAFIRHPYYYYESTWRWLTKFGERKRKRLWTWWEWHPFASVGKLYVDDFSSWVRKVMAEEPLWVSRIYDAYVGPEGGEFCQFVGRTEHIADDLVLILGRLGYDVDGSTKKLSNLGNVNTVSISVDLDKELWETVEDHEVSAFRRWESKRIEFPGVSS